MVERRIDALTTPGHPMRTKKESVAIGLVDADVEVGNNIALHRSRIRHYLYGEDDDGRNNFQYTTNV